MGERWVLAPLAVWLIMLTAFDIRCRRLPNWLTLPGGAAILTGALVTGHGAAAGLGAAALFAVYAVVHLTAPAALGAGDAKLAIGVGALTGAFGVDVWAVSALGASVLTCGWAALAALCRSRPTVPHGSSMCIAAAVTIGLVIG